MLQVPHTMTVAVTVIVLGKLPQLMKNISQVQFV
jgi:hypothetical protein